MRILIVGGGNTGRNLIAKFCEERHDVVVLDHNAKVLEDLETQFDVLTIRGSGSNPPALEEAEIQKANMVIAATDNDEINVVACSYARACDIPHKIARISNPELIHSPKLKLSELGVDMAINQKEECADELFDILRMPGAIETIDMLDGKVLAVGVKVHMDSPLLQGSLSAFPEQQWLDLIRFIAILRGDDVIIPSGDTEFLVGDEIYFVGKPNDIVSFVRWAWPEHSSFQKVMIAGGGRTGMHLAHLLELTTTEVVLIEENVEKAERCSGLLDRTLVINGNALDEDTFEDIGIVKNTAFVSVMGNDENNIIGCLLAAKLGATFTAAQINKPEYVPIINNLSLLDRAVSPHLSMINSILHFVRGNNVKSAAVLHKLPGELLEISIEKKGKWTGKAIQDIRIPKGAIIATVLRDNDVCVAKGDLVFSPGDRVVIFCLPETVSKLENI